MLLSITGRAKEDDEKTAEDEVNLSVVAEAGARSIMAGRTMRFMIPLKMEEAQTQAGRRGRRNPREGETTKIRSSSSPLFS